MHFSQLRRIMQTLNFGMLGYGFMAKAHTHALRTLQYIDADFDITLRLVALAGRNGAAARKAADQLGWERATTDWHDLVNASALSTTAARTTCTPSRVSRRPDRANT